jgi:hypothetical protein
MDAVVKDTYVTGRAIVSQSSGSAAVVHVTHRLTLSSTLNS